MALCVLPLFTTVYLLWNQIDFPHLQHHPYINTLPDLINTLLHWNSLELNLLRGTNLYGTVLERIEEWSNEFNSIPSPFDSLQIPWSLYLWSCTGDQFKGLSFYSHSLFN